MYSKPGHRFKFHYNFKCELGEKGFKMITPDDGAGNLIRGCPI